MSAISDDFLERLEGTTPAPDPNDGNLLTAEEAFLEYELTPAGNGDRFVDMHRKRARYVVGIGWHVWDGKRWKKDDEKQSLRLAREVVNRLYALVGSDLLRDDEDRRKHFRKFATRSDNPGQFNDTLTIASVDPRMILRPDKLDEDPYALNVANGIVNLKDGTLHPHAQAKYLSLITDIDYDPACEIAKAAPTWLRFLDDVTVGNQDLIDYMQRVMGYALTGDSSEEIMLILYGLGENGKSKFVETMLTVFGEYGYSADPSLLMVKKSEGGPSPELLTLRGKRLVSAVETGRDKRLDESLVKRMTGRDTLTARYMRSDHMIEFRLQCLMILATNHKPRLRETGAAIRRRLRLIPWLASFPVDSPKRDPKMGEKLYAERAGILAWLVQGCLAWQRDGLGRVEAITTSTNAYMDEEDAIGAFLDDSCDLGTAYKAEVGELYLAYTEYAKEQGDTPISNKAFGTELSERGFDTERTKSKRYRRGLTLRHGS